MERARFVVGIDLGTTNTVVASAPVDGAVPAAPFAIIQRTAPGTIEPLAALRSTLYAPLAGEIPEDHLLIDFVVEEGNLGGREARLRVGMQHVPPRLAGKQL